MSVLAPLSGRHAELTADLHHIVQRVRAAGALLVTKETQQLAIGRQRACARARFIETLRILGLSLGLCAVRQRKRASDRERERARARESERERETATETERDRENAYLRRMV